MTTQSRNHWDVALRFSRYEDFHRDQTAFFAELLDFFGVSAVDVKSLAGESLRTNGVHYRRGEVDEWRRIFSAEQATRATNAIPEELCQRFGWSR